jgi:amino acid transporter
VKVRLSLGLAIASGAPVLVLVSAGPVAALTGPASVLIWSASASIGMLMAFAFAELGGSLPGRSGGIAALTAEVLGRRSRTLAAISQWSYWFGWSPTLAINAALVGGYVQALLLPHTPAWVGWLLAGTTLCISAAINLGGIRVGGWVQLVLAVCALVPLVVLAVLPWSAGMVQVRNFQPFAPAGGWLSAPGLTAVAGGLFIAGWSAYGCELALTYTAEYRDGTRDAIRCLLATGVVSVVAYSAIPIVLIGVLGTASVQSDPSVALLPFARRITGRASVLVVGMLLVSLMLSVNLVMIGSSRLLRQMGERGFAWERLARLNRRGAPHTATLFDTCANAVLLAGVLALSHGAITDAPIYLLAAANVGYFVTIVLAQVAAWLRRREVPADSRARYRAPAGIVQLGLVLAALNAVLLLSAGFAWGWANIGWGVLCLAGSVLVLDRGLRSRRQAAAAPAEVVA